MPKHSEEIKRIAWACYKYLLILPYNSEISTSEIAQIILTEKDFQGISDLMDVHYALMDIIKSEGAYIMDNTKYYFQCVGTPENIPYFFRPKYPIGWAIFQNLLSQIQGNPNDN